MKQLLLSLILLVVQQTIFAQVVINEYSCSNVSTLTDNFNNYEDWVELFNNGNNAINLSGYYLSDNATNPQKWKILSRL